MKIFKWLIALFSFILFFGSFIFAMHLSVADIPDPISVPVEVFSLPQDTSTVRSRLDNLLDNAKQRVLLAMYWLTDDKIIDKLIDLKKKKIDVQIIFDESMDGKGIDIYKLMNKFLNNGIVTLIFPSNEVKGRMHNKFMIVDDNRVWTGSANFTKTVLDPKTDFKNNENVLIFYSKDMATKFERIFEDLKKEIFEFYALIIADNWLSKLPEWLKNLAPILYKKDNDFELIIKNYAKKVNLIGKDRLQKLFSGLVIESNLKQPISYFQTKELLQAGYKQYQINNMSYDKAYNIIGKMREQKRKDIKPERWRYKQRYSPYSQSQKIIKRPTDYQKNILHKAGYPDYEINRMSYDEAYQLIGDLMSSGSSESSQEFSFPY